MPVEDLEGLMQQVVVDSGLAEEGDFGELVGTAEEEETQVVPPAEEEPAPAATTEEEQPAAEQVTKPAEGEAATTADEDELDRELAGLGINAKDGQGRETRIRYSRFKKMWANREAKLKGDFEATGKKSVEQLQQQVQERDRRLSEVDVTNNLIQTNPGFYLQALLAVRPDYKDAIVQMAQQLTGGKLEAPANGPAGGADDDPMPQPDGVWPDGTKGYTPEGLAKRDEWFQRRIINQVDQRFKQQYGKPLETIQHRERMAAEQQMNARRVQQNVEIARKTYGAIFDKDFGQLGNINPDSQIMKVLNEHRNAQGQITIGFLEACALALVPQMQADRNTMREDLLKELQNRPAAARRSPAPAQVASKAEPPSTVEGIIAEQMRRANMI